MTKRDRYNDQTQKKCENCQTFLDEEDFTVITREESTAKLQEEALTH